MKILNSYKKNINKVRGIGLLLFCCLSFSLFAQKQYIVVLDAGHGGKDGGASRGKYIEKHVALNVVLKAGKILEKNKNLKVVYTRTKDKFIELHKRATIANDNNADLFVSIHCNANNSAKPFGAETYVLGLSGNHANLEIVKKENEVILLENDYEKNYDYDPNSPESVIGLSVLQEENLDESLGLAGMIQTNFRSLKRYDRSVKQANFLVLRETVMPSVLIELGFLSNESEGKFLTSPSGQSMMAGAVARAVNDYIHYLQVNTIDEVTPEENIKPVEELTKPVLNTQPKIDPVKKVEPTKKVEKIVKEKPVKPVSNIKYKIQIAASKKFISPQPYNFKGLEGVEMKQIDDYYKYYYGSVSKYKDIKSYQEEVKLAGFKGFFVVPFKNGIKISLKEALKIE